MSMFHFFDPDNLPESMPEDMKEDIRRHHDRDRMTQQVAYHDLNNFMESLNQDQLKMLSNVVITTQNNEQYTGYILGRIEAEQRIRFGICTCGEKHVWSADEVTESDPEFKPKVQQFSFDDLHPADQTRIMNEYHVAQDSRDTWRCTLCGLQYVSVNDRMLKNECHGCERMSATGAPNGPRPGDRDW